jgi:hypothetical protein
MVHTRTGNNEHLKNRAIRTVASSRRAASKERNGFRKARIKRLAIVVLVVGVTAHLTVNPVSADIIGFANGVGYTSNNGSGSPSSFSGNSLTLTNSSPVTANTVFFNIPQSVTGFTVSFTYQATNPSGICFCDGAAFILQTSAGGIHAIGGGGGGLGYSGIAPSAAIEFSPDNGSGFNPGAPGTGFYTNGATAQSGGPPLFTFINIGSTDVIEADLSYSGTTLSEMLTDLTTSATFSHTFTGINLASILGSSTAFVGFSGGTGAGASTQVLTNFSYTTSAVPEPSTWAMLLLGFAGLGFVFKQSRRKVSFA